MQHHAFHVILAICLVAGTWCASQPAWQRTTETTGGQELPISVPAEADSLEVRTGDSFWGLHLDGVLPCSHLLVKGGGSLITLSSQHDHDARCIYQVVREKRIILHGQEFLLRVVAVDQIHVERAPVSMAVATSR